MWPPIVCYAMVLFFIIIGSAKEKNIEIAMTKCDAYESPSNINYSGRYVEAPSLEKKKEFASYESISCPEHIYAEIGKMQHIM